LALPAPNSVILSEASAKRSEALAQSKDPYSSKIDFFHSPM